MAQNDFSELTEEEQIAMLRAQPNAGQTDNSPQDDIPQPPQHLGWDPNTDPNFDTVDPKDLV